MTPSSELPLAVVLALKKLPAHPPGEVVGELFQCEPYCESVGKIYSAKPGTSASGFRVQMDAPPGKAPPLTKLKVLVDPVRKAQLDASETHEGEGVEESTMSADGKKLLNSKPRSNLQWNFGFGLDVQAGARSVSTNSNTDTQTDAGVHPVLGLKVALLANHFSSLGVGLLSGRGEAAYWDGISEKSSTGATGRTSSSQAGTFQGALLWQKPKSRWQFGFLLEGQLRNFSTDPNTATGFSSQGLYFSVGAEADYRVHSIRLLRSILGTIQDVDQYRGTSVSGTLTQIQLRSCKGLGEVLTAGFNICGIGDIDLATTDGSGTPVRTVFTSDPHYTSTEWRIGFELGLTGIEL